jgi:hypothetical protein
MQKKKPLKYRNNLSQSVTNLCEFCGEPATKQSHLSPMGFIVMRRSRGFSEYDQFWYCEEHYIEQVSGFWNRVGSKIPDGGYFKMS